MIDLLRIWLHGSHLHVEPDAAEALAAGGIRGVRSFHKIRPTAGEREGRSVVRLDAVLPAGARVYYVKAYRYGGWRILRTFLWRAKAQREFANLRAAAAAGVPAVRPVAWAVRRWCGFIPATFLITEAFERGANAREVVTAHVLGRSPLVPWPAFRAVLDRVVDGLRRLHDEGMYLHTAFEKNLLVRPAGDVLEYCWVDLPFAGRYSAGGLPAGRRVRDLACLNKGLEAALPRSDRLRLLRRYLGGGADRRSLRQWAGDVDRRTRALKDETAGARLVKRLKG